MFIALIERIGLLQTLKHTGRPQSIQAANVEAVVELARDAGAVIEFLGTFSDRQASVRLIVPFPTWEDFLRLALDEIRAYGADSVQVMRRCPTNRALGSARILPPSVESIPERIEIILDRRDYTLIKH